MCPGDLLVVWVSFWVKLGNSYIFVSNGFTNCSLLQLSLVITNSLTLNLKQFSCHFQAVILFMLGYVTNDDG